MNSTRSPVDDALANSARWRRAVAFAAEAHRNQLRPDGHTPFIAHPFRVALLISADFGCSDTDVLVLALLHDVLEKTLTTRQSIRENFGEGITAQVEILSKVPHSDEDRYWARIETADWHVRLVKIADVCENFLDGKGHHADRVTKVRKALNLSFGSEPAIQLARERLLSLLEG